MLENFPISDRATLAVAAAIFCSAFIYGLTFLLLRKSYSRVMMFSLITLGFIVQTTGLNLRGLVVKGCPLGNPFEITQFICWSLILLYFIIGPVFKLRLLGFFTTALAAALCGISLLIPAWDSPYPPGIFGGNPWIELHAALAIFSYGMFATVALVSVMFLIQQHGLKKKQFKGIYAYLPSVQQLDNIAKRLSYTGVFCLSAALAFGTVFWVENPSLVPVFKLSVTCFVWFGYLIIVALRLKRILVTRRHAIASIALFICALISLWPVQTARNADTTPTAAQTTPAANK